MGILSKGSILAADDIKIKFVDVPEWGGKVGLRVISGTARDKFEACYTEKNMVNFRVKFLAASLCGEDGELLFTDADVGTGKEVEHRHQSALQRGLRSQCVHRRGY